MKTLGRFLGFLLCIAPMGAVHAVVSGTVGSNLTAYNGEAGAINNNRWNTLMNSRTGGSGTSATADFGNCNALIMRCAQPKCANGGCTDISVTAAIVSGCVQSNAACKQYGDDLVQYISAQLVAQSTARANEAANAANAAAAERAAQQNAQQMAEMQAQMLQMQSEMAAQNAATVAKLQNALDEQKQLTANALAEVSAARESGVQPTSVSSDSQKAGATATSDLSNAQMVAAQNGVSADILAREQITGQIMSAIENAETQLKTLKATMNDAFSYAGCDSRGNNCVGPKRVKMFKQKAEEFFDPYENVLDELYDALILAQSVGVDITDIYMMLNGSCNVWGQYLCGTGAGKKEQVCDNTTITTGADDKKTTTQTGCHDVWVSSMSLEQYDNNNCKSGKSIRSGRARGGHECAVGNIIPPEDDVACTLNKTIVDNADDPVQRDWLWAESNTETGANIRVGCASSALETSAFFRGRKKQATIDIETLKRIIAQDAPAYSRSRYQQSQVDNEQVKYCAINESMYADLQKLVTTRTLPKKDLCINDQKMNRYMNSAVYLLNDASLVEMARTQCNERKGSKFSEILYRCFCEKKSQGDGTKEETCDVTLSEDAMHKAEENACKRFGGEWKNNNTCDCEKTTNDEDEKVCNTRFGYTSGTSSKTTANSGGGNKS